MCNEKVIEIKRIQIIESMNSIRLSAWIKRGNEDVECWFEYPAQYKEFVCFERCDSFIIAILPYAMRNSYDIISEIPMSERLKYQIDGYYIPVLSKYQKGFSKISIKCDVNSEDLNAGDATGTGISCGVDSFYTILKHIDCQKNKYRLTHLVTMNVGSFGYQGGDFSYHWFQKEIKKAEIVSAALKLPLVQINSNLMEFYRTNHAYSGTFRMTGAVLGLQKLFSRYYISAGFDIKDFNITSAENDDYDLFNLMVASNESIVFYSSGLESTRFERTKFISNYPITYKNLTVCDSGVNNCGHCEKCLRTMGTLYAIGKLENYNGSFNTDLFLKHRIYNIAKIRYFGRGYMLPLYKEVYNILKKKNRCEYLLITCFAYVLICPIEYMKKILKKILPEWLQNKLRSLYHGG